jgi:hypothetical protein
VDSVSDRDQMLVKFPRSDRVEQLALGILERSIPAIGAKASLDLRIHGERSRPTSCPPDRTNSTCLRDSRILRPEQESRDGDDTDACRPFQQPTVDDAAIPEIGETARPASAGAAQPRCASARAASNTEPSARSDAPSSARSREGRDRVPGGQGASPGAPLAGRRLIAGVRPGAALPPDECAARVT